MSMGQGLGASQASAPTALQPSYLMERTSELSDAISELQERIALLSEKLTPVLLPPNPESGNDSVLQGNTEVGQRIGALLIRVQDQTASIQDLLVRVEV